jgi:branched-subunit amino acid aminotransferase/4-amino-4-deoxychorismate lyase
LYALLKRNALRDAILRITISRGSGTRGPGIAGVVNPTYLIACYRPAEAASAHLKLELVSVRRTPTECIPGQAKTANYLNSILALAQAHDAGADEALLLDMRGLIAEAAYSNVFFVRDARLITPALESGILPGITRAAVLEIAREHGVAVQEGDIEPAMAAEADEAFITNSVRGIVPVRAIGTRAFTVPGPLTARLAQWYWELVEREAGPRW